MAAYGDVDELNSCLGACLAALSADPLLAELRGRLNRVQEELFIVGALLASPEGQEKRLKAPFDQGLPEDAAARLEREIDAMSAESAPVTRFIMPGGAQAGAWLHLARAVGRRAERAVVTLSAREKLPEGVLVYLNRLSDWLFTAARWVNAKKGAPETPWQGLSKK